MQEQNEKKKLKAIKHSLSILNAENISLSQKFLESYFSNNSITLPEGLVLYKKRGGCGANYRAIK